MYTFTQPQHPVPQPKSTKPIAGLAMVLVAGMIVAAQENNQFVRPLPGPPAPVVPQLPTFLAELKAGKSLCHSNAQLLKRMARERHLSSREFDNSQRLYIAVKSKQSACLQFIRTAMVRRFMDDDLQPIQRLLRDAAEATLALQRWTDSKAGRSGALGSLGNTSSDVLDWLNSISEQNEAAIQQITKQLDDCELPDWDAIP